ncbi:hypothetical protein GB931_00015 [Modestobacter sp. I12A-02628]|uniref:DUF6194 domain-containing protein n=1 Tax=Goekera deserti TaxID=2497753 RepID=A0A7K3WIJ0_9ACTN|nr:DUF6194 family protein [Goekera deserti]MPQ96332.1 hypothetical protein [Goekera deserti]NDI50500.1 hypothetical protein [Goekera deserti]NEL56186.1 hypothetical protein [Goekera deserti]
MDLDDCIAHAVALDSVMVVRRVPGDGSPEISWGDAFIYYAPGGRIPPTQPFATVVTKDHPDEPVSGLDEPGAFRLNLAVPAAEFARALGARGAEADAPRARDAWFPHPVYGRAGWLSIVSPDTQRDEVRRLIDVAHEAARARHDRRAESSPFD